MAIINPLILAELKPHHLLASLSSAYDCPTGQVMDRNTRRLSALMAPEAYHRMRTLAMMFCCPYRQRCTFRNRMHGTYSVKTKVRRFKLLVWPFCTSERPLQAMSSSRRPLEANTVSRINQRDTSNDFITQRPPSYSTEITSRIKVGAACLPAASTCCK